ncbi:mechanosensitive ion channel domain-containing protein [Aquincola sp. MAHUQ-54]|uniref:Mechanosensitive ion channel domain-containing protein n=1 Tax=Aquincola agrisoli TaxID=3119538 RepID=A0AAW9QG05_9BURK
MTPATPAASAASTVPASSLHAWFEALLRPAALVELALLAACLGLAGLVVWLLRGQTGQAGRPGSIWFGARLIDGVLFPVLALAAVFSARQLLAQDGTPRLLLNLAVPVLVSLVVIRVGVRVMRAAFPQSQAVRIVERWLSWLVWLCLVLWLTGLLPVVLAELEAVTWTVGGSQLTLRSVIEGVLSAVVVLVLALWLSAALESRLLAGIGTAGFAGNVSLRKIAANATRALLLIVGLLCALSAAGIPLAALSVFGGAIGVGIGLGLQKLAANYVSGFVLLAENSLRIGDMVVVDGFEGRITDISTRYTVIRALNGRESIVPNEMMITQRVVSLTMSDTRVSGNTVVQVAYGTDIDALIPQLVAVVGGIDRVLSDPAPSVALTDFAANGIELTIGFWIRDPHNGLGGVRSNVNLAVLRTLDSLGIEIPYPQQVVHEVRPRDAAVPAPPAAPGPPAA